MKLALFIIPIFIPINCYAEDTILGKFTKSISTVYVASKSCENTIAPGPKEYISLITDYFTKLYPNGTGYWVIPLSDQVIDNPVTCIRLIKTGLYEYEYAREDYRNNYPSRNQPPILVAYQWEKIYIETPPPTPFRSYTPLEKPKSVPSFPILK